MSFPKDDSPPTSDNVRVAVRVRPFAQREKDRGSKCVISMDGNVTKIVNPKDNREHTFAFDFSYWSFDMYSTDSTGYMKPSEADIYADQKKVFDDLGFDVLENAWKGYNVSLFAYGQTGSGKSYSMVGTTANKGIVPLACSEIFRRIRANSDEDLSYSVETSMMEIYNEKVKDLFNARANPPGGLRVREHPRIGPFVEGCSRLVVNNIDEMMGLIGEGSAARTIGATNMNETSSRAHTIFQIILTQTMRDLTTMKATTRVSKINLVDLAGSERADSTQAKGKRLKEGAMINKSLTTLGSCIKALTEAKPHVPYRDSTLTWLLKESLGGNAKTIMIAALSPADINYEETLSTLRYADRAKQIVTNAIVNEDPNQKLIRELRDEINNLKQLAENERRKSVTNEEDYSRVKAQLVESQLIIQEMTMSQADKQKYTDDINAARHAAMKATGMLPIDEIDKSRPFLINLNEDSLMTEQLAFNAQDGELKVGRKNDERPPDVVLGGLSIQKHHVTVTMADGVVTIHPIAQAKVFHNGVEIHESFDVHQNDRVLLGNNHYFRVEIPEEAAHMQADAERMGHVFDPSQFDFEFARREITQHEIAEITRKQKQEAERKMKEMEDHMRQVEEKLKRESMEAQKQLEEYEKKLEEGMDVAKQKAQMEFEERRLREEYEAELQKHLELERKEEEERNYRRMLADTLEKFLPLVHEGNQISREIGMNHMFEAVMMADINFMNPEERAVIVNVKCMDLDNHRTSTTSAERFTERVYEMREIYAEFMEAGEITLPDINPWEPGPEAELVGKCAVFLKPLSYLVDTQRWTPIVDHQGMEQGQLMIHIKPCDVEGELMEYEEESISDEELKGQEFFLAIELPEARGMPISLRNDCHVKYSFFHDDDIYETEYCNEATVNPKFNYTKIFAIPSISDSFCRYLEESSITFEVYGYADPPPAGSPKGTISRSPAKLVRRGTQYNVSSPMGKSGPTTPTVDAIPEGDEEDRQSVASPVPTPSKMRRPISATGRTESQASIDISTPRQAPTSSDDMLQDQSPAPAKLLPALNEQLLKERAELDELRKQKAEDQERELERLRKEKEDLMNQLKKDKEDMDKKSKTCTIL
eukprot:GFYU01001512.1.p1 GENE.GFYU01001512.1~~GFYU01001512.1.p1  ORF type:complete len:1106 (+),score=357.63 GFYU01001512.1:278-3595(+)